ncbi:MAG: MaoC/PaaZ C-terminal domain-containing protein [Alphaproteobacteria bacterium]|jgi:acyl dehydratase|nr:MaoC/PaaZ C-terminal domain-containing protein [Alphaproteobacteria bacterium]MDP6813519.1 MaoC/PaaZ C-terminal domain-containing protein [Alphaproteobacteria bacterium]
MAIDYDKLLNWPFPEVVQTYTSRDSILYALGVGLNMDPLDEAQLRFTYEDAMQALPTMGVVLATPGFWVKDPDTGVDWVKVLHGEQGLRLHRPLPAEATVVATNKVTEIVDKGEGKGALLLQERVVVDQATGEALATLYSTTFARGDGGFGGPTEGARPVHALPEREPDTVCDLPTLPQAALIYRLSGDYNPLHADPKVAAGGGFKAPILHGLCTFGVAGHAILRSYCDYDPTRFKAMSLRFSSPVYPGETIRTEMWRDGEVVSFRSRVVERDVVVLNNGRAEVA